VSLVGRHPTRCPHQNLNYSGTMARKLIRVVGLVFGAGVGIWLGRLIAHSKVPPPEGKWREIPPEELA
jgi:hypothetical protein